MPAHLVERTRTARAEARKRRPGLTPLLVACAVTGVAWGVMGGAAQAQTATSRISDFNVAFSNPTFSDASVSAAIVFNMPAQAPFTKKITRTYPSGATNLTFNDSGGITQTEGTPTGGKVPFTITGDGAAGTFGFDYDLAASKSGPLLTLGRSGDLSTLTFDRSGTVNAFTPFDFEISVALPGNWTHAGTSTGDYELLGEGPGFSTPQFVFNPNTDTTLVTTSNPTYGGTTPGGLDFTLFGAPVPEPGVWAMMLVGMGGLGAALRSRRRLGADLA